MSEKYQLYQNSPIHWISFNEGNISWEREQEQEQEQEQDWDPYI